MEKRLSPFVALASILTVCAALAGVSRALGDGGMGSYRSVQGSGHRVQVNRSVGEFRRVQLDGSIALEARVGDRTVVTVDADDNIVPLVVTRVQGDTLHIGLAPNTSISSNHQAKVELVVRQLDGVSLQGSGDVDIRGLRGKKFDLDLEGSGNIAADGQVNELSVKLSGSGDLDLARLAGDRVVVELAGSGNIKVNAVKALDVNLAGSGNVTYGGHPEKLTQSVSGSGSIEPAL